VPSGGTFGSGRAVLYLSEMADRFFKFDRQKAAPGTAPRSACAQVQVEGAGGFTVTQVSTIGRAPDCDIHLDARSVSRNHARLFYEGGHFWIKDLGSANGTEVNGKKVKLQMLADGDKLAFGDVKAVFCSGSNATGPAAVAEDPLADSDQPVPDGTPTGGLGEVFPAPAETSALRPPQTAAGPAVPGADTQARQFRNLMGRVESLQAENERLRREICRLRPGSQEGGSTVLQETAGDDVERLRRLVAQLERALADSNLRTRNLQQRLDELS